MSHGGTHLGRCFLFVVSLDLFQVFYKPGLFMSHKNVMGRNLCSVIMRKSSMSMIFLVILEGIRNFGEVVMCEKWH